MSSHTCNIISLVHDAEGKFKKRVSYQYEVIVECIGKLEASLVPAAKAVNLQ